MDILEELPIQQWPMLQKKLQRFWPLNIPSNCALSLNMKNSRLREAFQYKVYCPYGDMDNGFIATSFVGVPQCMLFAVSEDTSKLEEALLKTKLIDWSKTVRFRFVSSIISKSAIISLAHFNHYHNMESLKIFYLDRSTKPFQNLRCPPNTYLGPIKEDLIHMVNDSWLNKYPGSYFFYSTLASNGLSYGLYSCSTKELLAWLFLNESNEICHFYCKESHRRLGYGEFLLRTVVNDLLNAGYDAFVLVIEDNKKPLSVLRSVGFQVVDGSVACLFTQKNII